jgi:hypothetical protein
LTNIPKLLESHTWHEKQMEARTVLDKSFYPFTYTWVDGGLGANLVDCMGN